MFIIDIQGFSYGNFCQNFICKEIAILNVQTGESVHTFLEIPHQFDMFNKNMRNHMGWLLKNHHGLAWICNNCPSDLLHYNKLSEFIKNIIQDNKIFIKGREKREWLSKLVSNNEVVNVEDDECRLHLTFKQMKEIFQSKHCNQHKHN
jgi:hypothetical protein